MSYQDMKRHRGNSDAYYLSERSQPEKATCCMMIQTFWKRKNYRESKRIRA